jgi:alcohol-forming fatty acyl-CoA reductase
MAATRRHDLLKPHGRKNFRARSYMTTRPAIATRIAAFFDIDGTLLPAPSLERRFFATLRRSGAIPPQNYYRWLARTIQIAPRGIAAITNANKMYLRNIPTNCLGGKAISCCADSSSGNGASTRQISPNLPPFLAEALTQAAWHASLGHAIVLVTGTLAPLAHQAAIALMLQLVARGVTSSIAVCATRLEERNSLYTGEITGEPIFGPAKARAIRRIAAEEGFDLPRCYAYADSGSDRWMLAAVGRPAAVNPIPDLQRVAHLHGWPILHWHPTQHAKTLWSAATRRRHYDRISCKNLHEPQSDLVEKTAVGSGCHVTGKAPATRIHLAESQTETQS